MKNNAEKTQNGEIVGVFVLRIMISVKENVQQEQRPVVKSIALHQILMSHIQPKTIESVMASVNK